MESSHHHIASHRFPHPASPPGSSAQADFQFGGAYPEPALAHFRQRPSAFVVTFSTTTAPRRNTTIIDHEHRHCNGPFTGSPRPTVVRRGSLRPCASVPFPLPFQLAVVASIRRCTTAAACSTIWKWQPPRRADCAQIFAAKRVSTPPPPSSPLLPPPIPPLVKPAEGAPPRPQLYHHVWALTNESFLPRRADREVQEDHQRSS